MHNEALYEGARRRVLSTSVQEPYLMKFVGFVLLSTPTGFLGTISKFIFLKFMLNRFDFITVNRKIF